MNEDVPGPKEPSALSNNREPFTPLKSSEGAVHASVSWPDTSDNDATRRSVTVCGGATSIAATAVAERELSTPWAVTAVTW